MAARVFEVYSVRVRGTQRTRRDDSKIDGSYNESVAWLAVPLDAAWAPEEPPPDPDRIIARHGRWPAASKSDAIEQARLSKVYRRRRR